MAERLSCSPEPARPSTAFSPPVDYLLHKLGTATRDNRKLRREVRELRKQRDRWREEARNWKWGALHR